MTSGISTILLYAPSGFYWVDDPFVAQAWLFYALSLMFLYVPRIEFELPLPGTARRSSTPKAVPRSGAKRDHQKKLLFVVTLAVAA